MGAGCLLGGLNRPCRLFAAGAIAAVLVTRFRIANETLTPLAIAISAIPIVATAPVFNAWYGILGPKSNQAVVVLLTSFCAVIEFPNLYSLQFENQQIFFLFPTEQA